MNEIQKYPIGVQSFEKIIRNGFLYVDKTEFIYRLVTKGEYYFLSRPRRFGKSLLLSTLEAFFLGKRELFKGLAIDSHDDITWEEYPVLHLDLNAKDYTKDDAALYVQIDSYLRLWEERYGVRQDIPDLDTRFAHIIETIHRTTGKKVVVLIDEYDKPLLQNISRERRERQNRLRETLKGFYGVLKTCDPYIRFAFLTGVTKFGKVSVFSDLNNLRDLTLEPDYNAICGITESELLTYMRRGIELIAEKQCMSFQDTLTRLRSCYDGYRFSEDEAEGIYNPFSLLNIMESRRFADYWFLTATPTMLVELLRDRDIDLTRLDGATRTENELMGLDPEFSDPIPLLFQSGYLTIKGIRKLGERALYRLGFPNTEVQNGFMEALFPFYVNRYSGSEGAMLISDCVASLEDGDVESFMNILKSLLAGVPYSESGDDSKIYEGRFRDVMYIVCKLMGMSVLCELHTALGRIDMTVETDGYIYVMEFKVDQSPTVAIQQIEDRHYTERYHADRRTIVKVGVEFSTAECNITSWTVEISE